MKRIRLANISISRPCDVSWTRMAGGDRTRACSLCDRDVHNLSALTRKESERLLANSGGRMCVAFSRHADGTIVTADRAALSVSGKWAQLPMTAMAAVLGLVAPATTLTAFAAEPQATGTAGSQAIAGQSGTILGRVTFTDGSTTDGIAVTAVNKRTAARFTATTNVDGRYEMRLPVGLYDVTIHLPGFTTTHLENIGIFNEIRVPHDAELRVGGLIGEVIVVAPVNPLEVAVRAPIALAKRVFGR